jgi:hypothetical protein
MVGVKPQTAAVQVYGEPSHEGQSVFAIATGTRFDRIVTGDGSVLLELLRRRNVLAATECKIIIVPELSPGTTTAAMARRVSETNKIFKLKLRRDEVAPNIVIKPRVPVTLLGVEHGTEPDALVAADADAFYRPIEIKSYLDRGGKTDSSDIRAACQQAAVGVVGLRQVLTRLGISEPARIVPPAGDLILRAPGSMRPTLRPMTLRGEVDSLERAINEAPRSLTELEQLLGGGSLDKRDVLDSIPNNFRPSCKEHCPLTPICKRSALAAGDPVILGDSARELLAPAGSIPRVLDLLRGRSKPRNTAEGALLLRLQGALVEYRKAGGNG